MRRHKQKLAVRKQGELMKCQVSGACPVHVEVQLHCCCAPQGSGCQRSPEEEAAGGEPMQEGGIGGCAGASARGSGQARAYGIQCKTPSLTGCAMEIPQSINNIIPIPLLLSR